MWTCQLSVLRCRMNKLNARAMRGSAVHDTNNSIHIYRVSQHDLHGAMSPLLIGIIKFCFIFMTIPEQREFVDSGSVNVSVRTIREVKNVSYNF